MKIATSIVLVLLLSSCTLSFQNISTHGVASDLVDENQAATADVKPVVSIPATAL
ncbi:MAG: hypothetical protein Q8876_05705 [Bacillota bacterium]|nr:hypothetical protein [Bacillota bacterium]